MSAIDFWSLCILHIAIEAFYRERDLISTFFVNIHTVVLFYDWISLSFIFQRQQLMAATSNDGFRLLLMMMTVQTVVCFFQVINIRQIQAVFEAFREISGYVTVSGMHLDNKTEQIAFQVVNLNNTSSCFFLCIGLFFSARRPAMTGPVRLFWQPAPVLVISVCMLSFRQIKMLACIGSVTTGCQD